MSILFRRRTGLPYPISGVPSERGAGGGGVSVFDDPEALEINRARLVHIESMNLPLSGRSVLDAGAGVGHLAAYFEGLGCRVVCLEGREENVRVLKSRRPNVEAHVGNVETDSLERFGRFDIVLCYGLLYHLENPIGALRNMAAVCSGLMLLETVITDRAEPVLRLVDEPPDTLNQALGGVGGRPSPAFVAMALTRAGFPFVYAPKSPPDHPAFRFQWKNNLDVTRGGRLMRCVFVASRSRLDNPALSLLLTAPGAGPVKPFVEPPEAAAPVKIWFDVGAHLGETTFSHAMMNPSLRVYAFEPNFAVAAKRMGRLPNFVVIPMAVAETDGSAEFHVSSFDAASSLLPFHPEGVSRWIGGEDLKVEKKVTVPTVRLDTFLNAAGIASVDYLKVDAQGSDLAVIKSAGDRLKDIGTVSLEVQIAPVPLYVGGTEKSEVVRYMEAAGFRLISEERQSHGQEENLTFSQRDGAAVTWEAATSAPFSPARAYWNQRFALANLRERILALSDAVGHRADLLPYQWAQLMATVLEFRPDLILELGRGRGNSTCAFTEAANQLGSGSCRVLSLCLSDNWRLQTAPRLRTVAAESWFDPLQVLETDLLTFDYRNALRNAARILVFWNAPGFEIAECVLGRILPDIASREHLVIMHNLSDLRYTSPDTLAYRGSELWKGSDSSGSRLKIGHVDSAAAQAVAMLDFATRNRLTLDSADHSFQTELASNLVRLAEIRNLLGEDLFSLQGHWFHFSLNEHGGPYTFPAFNPASRRRGATWQFAL